jgi:hypothetical protein
MVRTTEDEGPDGPGSELPHEGEGERPEDGSGVDGGSESDEARELVTEVGTHTTRESEEHCAYRTVSLGYPRWGIRYSLVPVP